MCDFVQSQVAEVLNMLIHYKRLTENELATFICCIVCNDTKGRQKIDFPTGQC